MLWGGLRPIRRRFFLDVLTLLTLTYGIIIPAASNAHHAHAHAHAHAHDRHLHKSLLILPCLVTLITARFTHRWTISLPMIPIVLLQCTRYWLSHIGWAAFVIKILSLIFIAKSFLLTILFPAVKISPAKGKYNVGIIDLHIPVENFQHEHVTVRLLYPCLEKSERLPYFNVDTADAVCKLLIKIGAPPPLNKISFILDTWKLSTINAKRNATPLEHLSDQAEAEDVNTSNGVNAGNTSGAIASGESSTFPIVVYSHGLTGSAELYSYQTMSLAASGTVVMTIVHTDGSAIGVKRKDGSFMQYDDSIGKLSRNEETFVEHIRARRGQADYRAKEFLSAAQALLKLNETNIEELEHVGISFVNKLNTADVTAVGHSFGAATALGAANRRPDLFKCMVAHDPAIDWAPDDCRRALLPKHRFQLKL
jgi:dienelactone hydrolase